MTNKSLPLRALWNALGAAAYIALVALMLSVRPIEHSAGPDILKGMAVLLLAVFSVLVMGTLLLVPPLRLYLDGQKIEGVRLLLFTVMWMGILMLLAMIVMSVL